MRITFPHTIRARIVLAAIGLIQGLVYYLSHEFWPDNATSVAWVVACLFFVSGTAVLLQLSWTGKDLERQAIVTPVLPVVLALVAFWVWHQIPVEEAPYRLDDARAPTWIAGALIVLFLVVPFLQIFQRTGRRIYPYDDLFRRFWDNLFIVALGAAVVGAFWAIIMLWSELFKLIDVTLFEDVFTDPAFVSMSLTTVFGYTVALGREWDKLTSTLRGFFLIVLKALMPLLAVIALLFLVSLPFTGLQPLWDTRHASATLLSMIALTILFFNGAYQEGVGEPPYLLWVRYLVEAAVAVIPVFAAITLYALYLRIGQYGLTFERFYGVLFALGGMLWGIGYAVAVFRRRGKWLDSVPVVNMRMIWVVVVLAVLTHTPLLDPLRWSARNQYYRLSSGMVDAYDFDYGYLRFQLGHVGYETLERLESLSDHPQAATIRERVAATRSAESYAAVRPQPARLMSASDIVPLDSTVSLPDSLLRLVVTDLAEYEADECEENGDCTMFNINLDSDLDSEYILLLSGEHDYGMIAYDRDGEGKWLQAGRLRPHGLGARLPPRAQLLETLRHGGAVTEPPTYRDLRIGGLLLRLLQ